MKRQAHVEASQALASMDAMDSLEDQILQAMDGMIVRDTRRKVVAREGVHIISSAPSAGPSTVGANSYGYGGYGYSSGTGNDNATTLPSAKATKGKRNNKGKAKEVPGPEMLPVLTSIGRTTDGDRGVGRREVAETREPQHTHYLPYDFQLPHYSPFDLDCFSEPSSIADNIPPEPGEYERDIESKRHKQEEPSQLQYKFKDEQQRTPRQPPPPKQQEPTKRDEEDTSASFRLTSPFSPEFQYPQSTALALEADDNGNRSRSTSSSYSGDSGDSGSQPSSDFVRSTATTITSPSTQPTSPEPYSHRSPATSQSSDFQESLFNYYFDPDEGELSIGNTGILSSHGPSQLADADTMLFGDFRKNSVLAHRRRSMATTASLTDYEADLSSRDRNKQRDAIKRILSSKVKNDWKWAWPQDNPTAGTPILDRYLEDTEDHDWTERDEWTSNISESDLDEEERLSTAAPTVNGSQSAGDTTAGDTTADKQSAAKVEPSKDPFRFDSPDGVGDKIQELEEARMEARRARRWKRAQGEMRTNDGVRCFTQRRDAWTGARYVQCPSARRRRPSTVSVTSSRPPTPPVKDRPISTMTHMDAAREPLTNEEAAAFFDYMKIEVPIAKPILPPDTPMRRGINDKAYPTIYDKVVMQGQTPFCPINLSVVTKSCVEGWKRDGEWPARQTEPEAPIARRMSTSRPIRSGNGRDGSSRGVAASRKAGSRQTGAGGGMRTGVTAGGLSANALPIRKRDAREAREARHVRDILEEAAVATARKGKDDGAEKEGKGVLRRSLQKVFDAVHHKDRGPE